MTSYMNETKRPSSWGWLNGQGDLTVGTLRLTIFLSILVIIAAGVLGFTALRDLFISINLFNPYLGYLFPILFDAAEISFAATTLYAQLQGEKDRFAWWMVIIFTLLGIAANVAHAYFAGMSGVITMEQTLLAVFATSLFPLSIALVTHNLQNVIKRYNQRCTLIKTLAQLIKDITQHQAVLGEQVLEYSRQEQQHTRVVAGLEAERSALEQQKLHLEHEINQLKMERRDLKRGTAAYDAREEAELPSDTERTAYAFLAEQVRLGKRNSEITGADVGKATGTSDSFGRRLKNRLLDQVRADLGIPEPIPSPNGTHP